MECESLLVLAGRVTGDELGMLGSQPYVSYTPDEQRLSNLLQREIDHLLDGRHDQLVLLKLYPSRSERTTESLPHRAATLHKARGTIRGEVATRLATDAISFFGPLQAGIITQEHVEDVIVQQRAFSTRFPHIRMERYDLYDAQSTEPLLGAWRARRTQNQRRETQTNRMIDVALLVIEVSKSVFPALIG